MLYKNAYEMQYECGCFA